MPSLRRLTFLALALIMLIAGSFPSFARESSISPITRPMLLGDDDPVEPFLACRVCGPGEHVGDDDDDDPFMVLFADLPGRHMGDDDPDEPCTTHNAYRLAVHVGDDDPDNPLHIVLADCANAHIFSRRDGWRIFGIWTEVFLIWPYGFSH